MSYILKEKPVASIKANLTGTNNQIQIPGVTTAPTTGDNIVEQINKILGVAGQAISPAGLSRIRTEETFNDD